MKQVPEALIGRLHPDGEERQRRMVVPPQRVPVIRRTAAERRRGRRLLAGRVARWLQLTPATPAERRPDARLLADERDDALERALGRLSPRQREVLHLVFFQELTIEQAAEVLRVGTGSARTHYARGKRRLRELLEQDTTARGESGPGRVRIATDGR